MKKAVYHLVSGKILEVEYDENAPCKCCGLPVENASMSGTDVCPTCDIGIYRDGTPWETMNMDKVKEKARQIYNKIKGFIH
jgi:hypothetical protein